MSDKLKVHCPGCKKAFLIKVEHQGRKMSCPACATLFRAGNKAAPKPAPPSNPAPRTATPPMQQPAAAPVAQDPFGQDHGGLFDDGLDMLAEMPPAQTPSAIAGPANPRSTSQQQGGSRRQAYEKSRPKKRKASNGGMTESDEKLQNSMIFLVFLPLIASILPMMGLQIRRLRALGDAAPLVAILLALIGAGCIGYARRNKSDGIPIAIGAALFGIVTGIGGYALNTYNSSSSSGNQVAVAKPSNSNGIRTANRLGGGSSGTSSKPTSSGKSNSGGNKRPVGGTPDFRPENTGVPTSSNPFGGNFVGNLGGRGGRTENIGDDQGVAGTIHIPDGATEEAAQAARQMAQDQLERMRNRTRNLNQPPRFGGGSGFNPPNVPSRPGSQGGMGSSNPFGQNPFGGNGRATGGKNRNSSGGTRSSSNSGGSRSSSDSGGSDFVESLPHGFEYGERRSEAMTAWGKGMLAFSRAVRNKGKVGSSFMVSGGIGKEQSSGNLLYDAKPIRGIETIEFGGIRVVPVAEDDEPSDLAIINEKDGRSLCGFNLAFRGEAIVGFQGRFGKVTDGTVDVNDIETSHWLGERTTEVTPINSEKAIHGIVCFKSGRTITGFALVVKE